MNNFTDISLTSVFVTFMDWIIHETSSGDTGESSIGGLLSLGLTYRYGEWFGGGSAAARLWAIVTKKLLNRDAISLFS